MSLNELAKEAHQISVEHGWWDKGPNFGELVALMHSELSEALEEYRAGRPMVWYKCNGTPCKDVQCNTCEIADKTGKKPEGIAVELADCIIRILDWAGHEGVDLDTIIREKMDYNRTRPYRHGGGGVVNHTNGSVDGQRLPRPPDGPPVDGRADPYQIHSETWKSPPMSFLREMRGPWQWWCR